MPQHVLDVLAAMPVEEVTVLGRRGPAQATFTTQELRELDELDGATVLVDPADLELDPGSRGARGRRPERHPQPRRAARLGRPRRRRRAGPGCACASSGRPVRLLGEDRVTGVEVERTAVDGDGRAMGTGELEVLPADLVVRSVGYRGTPAARPAGRRAVGHRAATTTGGCCATAGARRGEYVAGWIKRGPSGVVGTNKHDARETVAALLADVADGRAADRAGRSATWSTELRRPRGRSRCCSTTGGRSTPPRSRSARPAAGRGRRCTSGRRCWPPSAPRRPVAGCRDRPATAQRVRYRA